MAVDPILNFAVQRATIGQKAGDGAAALRWFRAAACAAPSDPRVLPLTISGGQAMRLKAGRRALCLDPLSVPLLEAVGQMALEVGDRRAADVLQRKALIAAPATSLQAAVGLANSLQRQNRAVQAYPLAWLAAAMTANNAGTKILYATVAGRIGKFDQAAAAFRSAAALVPANAEILGSAAWSYKSGGDLDTAARFARQALMVLPSHDTAQAVLAAFGASRDDPEATNRWTRRLVRSQPGTAQSWYQSAAAWTGLGDHVNSWRVGRAALVLDPMHRFTMDLLARNAVALFWFEKGRPLARAGVTFFPGAPELQFHHADIEKAVGDLARGWDLEHDRDQWPRFHRTVGLPPRVRPEDLLPSDKLLVAGEQGLGDELTFLSCLPELLRHCAAPVVEADDRLHPMLRRSFPALVFVPRQLRTEQGRPVADYRALRRSIDIDRFLFSGDLPARFLRERVVDESRRGYLTPDATKVAAWRETLNHVRGDAQLVIGLAWSSGISNALRKQFNSTLDALLDLLLLPRVRFVSLQYHDCREEVAAFKARHGVDIWIPPDLDQRDDLDGTVALMAALDLVVSTDTAPCLLAAAVGCETIRLSMAMFGLHPERDLFFANMLPLTRTDETVDVETAAKRAARLIRARLEAPGSGAG